MDAVSPSSAAAQDLRGELSRLRFPVSEAQRLGLRDSLNCVVDEQKALGAPVERIILALKQIARDAGLQPRSRIALVNARNSGMDELLADIVAWAVARYFAETE